MSALYILIIVSITVAVIFLMAFIWSVKAGQYEDDYTPSVRILFDDEDMKEQEKEKPDSKRGLTDEN